MAWQRTIIFAACFAAFTSYWMQIVATVLTLLEPLVLQHKLEVDEQIPSFDSLSSFYSALFWGGFQGGAIGFGLYCLEKNARMDGVFIISLTALILSFLVSYGLWTITSGPQWQKPIYLFPMVIGLVAQAAIVIIAFRGAFLQGPSPR